MPSKKLTLIALITFLIALSLHLFNGSITHARSIETIQISSIPSGVSTRYIGAAEGNVNFDHNSIKGTLHSNSPIWLGEWGTYQTGYEDVSFAINLIKNMMRGSQPGDNYIYGSHIFSLYDWGKDGGFQGLISADGKRIVSYYAFRMGIRALQGGRSTFLTSTSNADLTAITTQDSSRNVYLLVANSGQQSYTLDTNFSKLMTKGTGTMWEFSSQVMDKIVSTPVLDNGHAISTIPANAAILIKFQEN